MFVNTQGGVFGTVLQGVAYKSNIAIIEILLDSGTNANTEMGSMVRRYSTCIGPNRHTSEGSR